MKDNVFAQMLIEEGREIGREEGREEGLVLGEKSLLMHMITKQFGSIDSRLQHVIDNLSTQAQVEAFLDRVMDSASVEELL